MALELNLKDKPWYFGAAIGLVLAVAIWGVAYWQLVTPKKGELAKRDQKLAQLQEKIQKGRAAKAKLPQFREEVRRLELELDKLLRILPARRNTADLLRRIRALTEQGDFDLKRFTPGGFSNKGFYSEWPIAIDLDGSYHNLALLFDRISRFSRIINIGDLKISKIRGRGAERSEHTISASFRALTFVYQEEEESSSPPAAKKGKGKKGAKR